MNMTLEVTRDWYGATTIYYIDIEKGRLSDRDVLRKKKTAPEWVSVSGHSHFDCRYRGTTSIIGNFVGEWIL